MYQQAMTLAAAGHERLVAECLLPGILEAATGDSTPAAEGVGVVRSPGLACLVAVSRGSPSLRGQILSGITTVMGLRFPAHVLCVCASYYLAGTCVYQHAPAASLQEYTLNVHATCHHAGTCVNQQRPAASLQENTHPQHAPPRQHTHTACTAAPGRHLITWLLSHHPS